MPVNQHGANFFRIKIAETLDDHIRGFQLIILFYLVFLHSPRNRNFTVEIVGMCCAQAGYRDSGLRKSRSVSGMSMDDRADSRESLIQASVSGRVRRGTQRTFNDGAVEIDYHHVVLCEQRIVDTARLNGKHTSQRVSDTNIAESKVD